MGNSASNANNPPRQTRTTSTSPGPGNPHRSLRTKKRSLELPDLASLSLPPATQPSSSRGRQSKSANIPIPVTPQPPFNDYRSTLTDPPLRAPVHLPSTTDVHADLYPVAQVPVPSRNRHHQSSQHYQSTQSTQSAPRGRQQPIHIQQQVMRIQDLYDRSQQQHSAAPPSSPATFSSIYQHAPAFVPEVVHSSIPTVLGTKTPNVTEQLAAVGLSPVKEDLLADPVEVKIVWKGGGSEVVLARAGDDEWKGRTSMERESPNSNVWTLTVFLQPGTHHVRFLVDGQWRVADDLPAAVDDQGSLANYVAVPLNYGLPGAPQQPLQISPAPVAPLPAPAPPKKVIPGQSFWSADSSADGETDDGDHSSTSTAKATHKAHDGTPTHKHTNAAALAYSQASWTSILPPELIEAAREEEAYLAASAGQYDGTAGNTRVTGFVPAPNIPPAPGLPRHLDKLILNSKVGEQRSTGSGGSNSGGNGSGGAAGSGTNLPGGVGSGQGGGRRERRERDRDRDRERDRERGERDRERGERGTRSRRGNVPPPPPPSETGDAEQDRDDPEPVPPPQPGRYMPAQLLNLHNQPIRSAAAVEATLAAWGTSTPATAGSGSNGNGTSTSLPTSGSAGGPGGPNAATLASASGGTLARAIVGSGGSGLIGSASASEGSASGTGGTTTAATSPQGSLPATPTGHQTPPKGVGMWGPGGIIGAAAAAASVGNNNTISSAPGSASGSPRLQVQQLFGGAITPNSSTNPNMALSSSSSMSATPQLQPPPGISGSRAITIDDANMPPLTDDGSVLPVPSHVVLHHLCTSAIRNGVLAVANTTRYRKKYLTTIYYKPT